MSYPTLVLELPPWIDEVVGDPDRVYPTVEDRMELAVALSRRNVEAGGGPFGAGVFDLASGRLVAPGVNLVIPAGTSIAHAEMVALALAQRAVGNFDLSADQDDDGGRQLVTSCEPCAQCFGAVPWSGVRSLVCGARKADAEEIGFDEGPKPDAWVAALERRGIQVQCDVLRDAARDVLQSYAAGGGPIYNAS